MANCPVHFLLPLCVAVLLAISGPATADPEQVSGQRSLAGQICPSGSFVIGFDAVGDILCSATCGNGVPNPGESCDDGNTKGGDGCSDNCQSESAASATAAAAGAAAVPKEDPPTEAAAKAAATGLVISDVEPSSVVYGTRELDITILGEGFHAGAVIEFAGTAYTPVVNPKGNRAEVTLTTRKLTLGAYALTISNPSGEKAILNKALVVY
jgi:cysteine-rich repeat protein